MIVCEAFIFWEKLFQTHSTVVRAVQPLDPADNIHLALPLPASHSLHCLCIVVRENESETD